MKQTDSVKDVPASLFLTIDDFDNLAKSTIKETSDEKLRDYILQELYKVQGFDVVPDYTIVEYRFPNRESIPSFDNEYYSRDLYYALDGKNVTGQYISLRMAAFLAKNDADVLQSKDVYRHLSECPECREFMYLNRNGLHKHPDLLNADDRTRLASIKAEGGPSLPAILSKYGRTNKLSEIADKKSDEKIGKPPPRHRRKPLVISKRNGNPKRTRGRSL